MKTALGIATVLAGGVVMMPLLVEPTPLMLWFAEARTEGAGASRLVAAEPGNGLHGAPACRHAGADAHFAACQGLHRLAGIAP